MYCFIGKTTLYMLLINVIGLIVIFPAGLSTAADWPMWRCNAARTAVSSEVLPDALHLQWKREYPQLKPAFWQVRQQRLQFDIGYEPVVLGKTMFVGSSWNDSVTALDVDSGVEKWRFYADGPVRLAPVAWAQKVFFTSDDGCLYCLDARAGTLLWKIRGSPSTRKIIGNGRLISAWPARGGPVLADGRIYFAAGVWPFAGVFVYGVDAGTGDALWINDRTGYLYTEHPHTAMSFGGPSPQGYFLIHNKRLVVPSSRAFPAFFDLETGKLLQFDFGHGGGGSRPGSWFLASRDDGNLYVDPRISTGIHDGGEHTIGQRGPHRKKGEPLHETVIIGGESYQVQDGISELIDAGGRKFCFSDGFPGVDGAIHTMLAADGKLFVVTRSGAIFCFGGKPVEPKRYPLIHQELQCPVDSWKARAGKILQLTGQNQGYALALGSVTGRLAEELIAQSQLHLIAAGSDVQNISSFRKKFDVAGLYGQRVAALAGNPDDLGFPPYFASLIVCENLDAAGFSSGEKWLLNAFESLRPYGGVMCLETTTSQHDKIDNWIKRPSFKGAHLKREGEFTLVVRAGSLPGAANYTGQANYDQLVKAPLGLLWFGDTFHHHKLFFQGYEHETGRGLPAHIRIIDGSVRYLVAKVPQGPYPSGMKYLEWVRQYSLKTFHEISTDVYTGRELSQDATTSFNAATGKISNTILSLARKNPITGVEEVREFIKTYGCDTISADYGNIITMRSGTAAYYDKRSESGTINISGTRSGCRNSIVPACGVLNIPSWTGNCTCNYPIFTSLALVPMPQEYEQWSAWGGVAVDGAIQRAGVNFGAPGDRMTDDGTLWVDWPSVGGPSPEVCVRVKPDNFEQFYRQSLWMRGGQSWPWVFASGIRAVSSIQIDTVTRKTNTLSNSFSVRWIGAVEPQSSEEFSFYARSDGPTRVWLRNRPLVDNTSRVRKDGQREASAKVALNAGMKYDILVEYAHVHIPASNVQAFVELSWSSSSVPKTVIPSERFYTSDGQRGGLTGVYYGKPRLFGQYVILSDSIPALSQDDPQVSFDWGKNIPEIITRQCLPARPIEQRYTIRLIFAEPDKIQCGERVFSVKLQGEEVLHDFDIMKEAGGDNRGILREFKGIPAKEMIEVEFTPSSAKPPLICGIELIAETPLSVAEAKNPAVLARPY